jgi:hypothetical protein
VTQLSGEELWALACIQQELPLLSVEQHDDGSEPSMYDLQITYPDGSIGAVEVTAAADAQQLELWKVVGGRGKRWIEPGLAGGWQVRILPSTRGKKLLSQLPGLLRDLEQTGIRVLRGDESTSDRSSALAGQLGIVQLKQGPTAHPGSIYVMPPDKPLEEVGGFSPANGDPLAKWVSEWILESSREDNLRKLADSGVGERHLFVLLPGFNRAPFAVNDLLMEPSAPLPAISPSLPAAVTHIWTMSMWDGGNGFRWAPDTNWKRFAKAEPRRSLKR